MKLQKVETQYQIQLKASEYDFLNVVSDTEGRIKIKFFDERWRTLEETVKMLKEIIGLLVTFTENDIK